MTLETTAEVMERDLDVISITINNICNLACPHCYLNVSGAGVMNQKLIDKLFEEPPDTIAIVGMEPFYDPVSAAVVRQIARRGKETDTLVSVVTNGLNLKLLAKAPAEEIPDLIDISLDGGPEYYAAFRGDGRNLFPKIERSVAKFRASVEAPQINVLHTLYAENASPVAVTDMMRGSRIISPSGEVYFSPFIPPRIEQGSREATARNFGLQEMLTALKDTSAFMDDPSARFFAGPYNAWAFGLEMDELTEIVDSFGLTDKSRLDSLVPHLNGSLRVTFDGYAIGAQHALHTADYRKHRIPIAGRRLVDVYEESK